VKEEDTCVEGIDIVETCVRYTCERLLMRGRGRENLVRD
jgi:hypothetical protein